MTLTNSSILTTGTQSLGIYTANGGTTKLTGNSISTTGANSYGVEVGAGGSIILNGGSITTDGVQCGRCSAHVAAPR